MKSRAFSYIRFSLQRQIEGDSLRRQSRLARDWCDANSIPLVEDYRDLGVSGYRGKNAHEGSLKTFLDAIEDGRVYPGDYLLIESLDRMGRQQVNRAMALLLQVINAGVVVVTLGEDKREYREDSPNLMVDLIMSLISMSRAHEESSTKSSRNRAAWDEKRRESAKSGKPISGRCPSWLNLVGEEFQVIPEKARIVREIFRMSADNMTVNAITRDLNSRGVPSLRLGRPWSPSTVAYLLDSRSVLGEFTPQTRLKDGSRKKLAPIRNYFPQIVDDSLFLDAKRNRGRAPHNRGRFSRNAFRGMIRSKLGYPIQMKTSKLASGREYVYLRYGASDRGVESHMMWRYDEFLEDFLRLLKDHLESPVRRQDSADKEELKRQIVECEDRIDNLALAIANGYSETLEKAIRSQEDQVDQLKRELDDAEKGSAAIDITLDASDPVALGNAVKRVVDHIEMDIENKRWCAHLRSGEMISFSRS